MADPLVTEAEVRAADELIERAMRPAGLYDQTDRWVRAILAANFKRQQRARGRKSRGAAKAKAAYRRNWVNLLLHCIISKKYRDNPKSAATVMNIIGCLDDIDIEASDRQVRLDIDTLLKSR